MSNVIFKKKLDKSFIAQMVINGGMAHIEALGTEIEAAATIQCPVDKNHLRSSHKMIRDDKAKKVLIGFGSGISSKYAVYQHENVGLHHKVGKAKWLQDEFEIKTRRMKKH
jgi:hypothetical protein